MERSRLPATPDVQGAEVQGRRPAARLPPRLGDPPAAVESAGRAFAVLRVGMDFRIRCTKCGREVMVPRSKIEKNIKKVVREALPL